MKRFAVLDFGRPSVKGLEVEEGVDNARGDVAKRDLKFSET